MEADGDVATERKPRPGLKRRPGRPAGHRQGRRDGEKTQTGIETPPKAGEEARAEGRDGEKTQTGIETDTAARRR